MSKRALEDLREMLCVELEEIAKKQELSAGDLETVYKLVGTVKNIYKIEMCEDGGYSQAGEWGAEMRGTYGNSYRMRDDRGRYMSGKRYSREDAHGAIREQLETLMDEASTDREREAIRRAMEAF